MFRDWEGNRRSGVALAMRHRLEWFIHLRAQGLSEGDDYSTNTPHGVWYSLCPVWDPGRKNRICSVSRLDFIRNYQIWLLSVILCYYLCLVVNVCSCCVRFSFFSITPRDWLGRTPPKWSILCRFGRKTLTQYSVPYAVKVKSKMVWLGKIGPMYCDINCRSISLILNE